MKLSAEDLKTIEERVNIFDHAMSKAYDYAESGKNTKLAREGIMCDAYLQGFLDGVAYRMGGMNE